MHRIPLQLPTPSVLWERGFPECVLFEETLNVNNVQETRIFINVLDEEAEFYQRQSYGIAEDMFWKAKNCLMTSDSVSFAEGMCLINSIILKTPKDSVVLAWALKIRGQFYYRDCCLEKASNDFEMYLHIDQFITSGTEDICEVVGHLIVCMYMMGQHVKAKKYFRRYKKYKAKLSSDILEKHCFVQIENHIAQFINELNDVTNTVLNLPGNVCSSMPFKKFSGRSGTNNGVYIDCNLQKADTIFVEDSMLNSINAPFVRCEVCYRQSKHQIYTCLDCRYKVYCSLCCLEKDRAEHLDECIGYKQLTLIILDANIIFRIFVRISNELNKHIFNRKIFRSNKTALEVWYNLLDVMEEEEAKENKASCLSVIAMKPIYYHLTDTQYSTLVTTAFRLAIFIDMKTQLIETYFRRLKISSKQKLIVVGSLLMRIHCNLLLNTFDFNIINDTDSQVAGDPQQVTRLITSSSPKHEHFIKDLNQFYDVDIDKEVWQRSSRILKLSKNTNKVTPNTLPRNQHTQLCNRSYRIHSIYKDNIAELYFNPELIDKVMYGPNADQPINPVSATQMCARLAQMTDIQRCYFVKRFARLFHNHYTEYFMQMADRIKDTHHIISVYSPTLRQFKHSCDPNVEIIVLDNGVVAGKALRDIGRGEQLSVAFTAHHMRHSHRERELFLKQMGIICQCKYCKLGYCDDPINLRQLIYCESCRGVEVTPEINECPTCGTQYNNLLIKYRTVLNVLENELNRELKSRYTNQMSDRDIYILHLMIYLHAKKFFGPQNEYRINIELKHARYLALKNFAHQSHQLIEEVRANILQSYGEHFIWFTYYAEMLLIIKIILCYNIEERLYPISSKTLMQLCDLGLYIVKGQLDLIEFYEIFDLKCSLVLNDLTLLLQWKDKIVCNYVVPSAESLKNSNRRIRSVSGTNQIPPL